MSLLRDFPALLTRDNRAKGLLNELADTIDAEDDPLALRRLEMALTAASHYARGRRFEIENPTEAA